MRAGNEPGDGRRPGIENAAGWCEILMVHPLAGSPGRGKSFIKSLTCSALRPESPQPRDFSLVIGRGCAARGPSVCGCGAFEENFAATPPLARRLIRA